MNETYNATILCPNCLESIEVQIPKGMTKQQYEKQHSYCCKNCGCCFGGQVNESASSERQILKD